MQGSYLTKGQTRGLSIALLLVPWLLLLLLRPVLSASLLCVFGFLALLSTLVALAFLVALSRPARSVYDAPIVATSSALEVATVSSQPAEQMLYAIPRTLDEVRKMMSPTDFEYFSAAVVMGLGEGHTFFCHCGGRGDQGVDAKLYNRYGHIVAIQSKKYAAHRSVKSREMRDFGEGMRIHKAVNGFFVTTSTLTPDAYRVMEANTFIRLIDGSYLERLLQERRQEIAQAYTDIRKSAE